MSSLSLLTYTEARKALNTRAGRGLLIAFVGTSLTFMAFSALAQGSDDVTAGVVVFAALAPLLVILPIASIVSFTTEWTTRNAMWTFLLVPRREKVILAKLGACALLSAGVVAISIIASLIAAHAVAAFRGGRVVYGGFWSGETGLNQALVPLLLSVLIAVAIGMLSSSTALAIAAYFLLTLFVGPALTAVLGDLSRWVSLDEAAVALATWEFSPLGAARTLVTILVWIVVPLCLGAVRYMRREAK